jgi:hypothetical protein
MSDIQVTRLKRGDRIALTRPMRWKGLKDALKNGEAPEGATGTVDCWDNMLFIKFDNYPCNREWPCLVGRQGCETPDWLIIDPQYKQGALL